MNNFKLKKSDLLIEGVSIKKLSKKFETPFYCYSSSTIIEKFKEFEMNHIVDFCLVDGSIRYETFLKSIKYDIKCDIYLKIKKGKKRYR